MKTENAFICIFIIIFYYLPSYFQVETLIMISLFVIATFEHWPSLVNLIVIWILKKISKISTNIQPSFSRFDLEEILFIDLFLQQFVLNL